MIIDGYHTIHILHDLFNLEELCFSTFPHLSMQRQCDDVVLWFDLIQRNSSVIANTSRIARNLPLHVRQEALLNMDISENQGKDASWEFHLLKCCQIFWQNVSHWASWSWVIEPLAPWVLSSTCPLLCLTILANFLSMIGWRIMTMMQRKSHWSFSPEV